MKTLRLALIAAVIGIAAPAAAQQPGWDQVVAAAKKEGTLTVYHAQLGAPHWKSVVKAFHDKYDIDVQEFDGRASEMTEHIRVEQTSQRFIADVEFHGLASIVDQRKTDFVAELGDLPNAKAIRTDVPPGDKWAIPAWIQMACMLVNTSLVKPADEPKSWRDVLDPKWKDKILSDDMRAIGSGATMFAVMNQAFGMDFLHKLKDQNLTFDRDLQVMSRRVARGEFPLFLEQIIAFASDLRGLPVKVVVPEEGCPVTPIQGAVLRGAPHPNAARLFINHFLDLDSQLTYANAWMGTVVNGVADKLTNPDAKRFAQAKVLGYVTPELRDPMLKAANEMFK